MERDQRRRKPQALLQTNASSNSLSLFPGKEGERRQDLCCCVTSSSPPLPRLLLSTPWIRTLTHSQQSQSQPQDPIFNVKKSEKSDLWLSTAPPFGAEEGQAGEQTRKRLRDASGGEGDLKHENRNCGLFGLTDKQKRQPIAVHLTPTTPSLPLSHIPRKR